MMHERPDPSRRTVLAGLTAAAAAALIDGCGGGSGRSGATPRRASGARGALHHVRYGPAAEQRADLHLPAGGRRSALVVILVHGGYWQPGFDRSLMVPLAEDLTARGHAVWNVEYRPVGRGGGWPGSFLDMAAAVDALGPAADDAGLDPMRVVVVGHSAGGTLALWAAARHRLPAGAVGARPQVVPCAAVSLAGVNDLAAGARAGIGGGACAQLMGGSPEAVPDRYRLASPRELLPLGVPQLIVHGLADEIVPLTQSTSYAAAARRAGDGVELLEPRNVDHFAVIDPSTGVWKLVAERLERLCRR